MDQPELDRRMDFAERDLKDHARIFSEFTLRFQDYDKRVGALEDAEQLRLVAEARRDERDKIMVEQLNKIKEGVSKLVWIAVAGVGAAFITFILNGGLKLP